MTLVYAPRDSLVQRKTPGCGFIGAPGSGKGTLCARLAQNPRFVPFGMGEAIRNVRTGNDQLASMVNDYYAQHGETGLLCDDLTRQVFDRSMQNFESGQVVMFDGVPRNVAQVPWVHESEHLRMGVYFTLEVSDPVAIGRMHKRGEEQKALMEAGRPHQFREEDLDPVACQRRLDTYREKTVPVLVAVKEYGARVVLVGADYDVDQKVKIVHDYLRILYREAVNR